METEIHPNRFDLDELHLLQGRALRSWRDSQWLAQNHPREFVALEDFPEDQVWLDIGGGQGESKQTPGAIVLGSAAKNSLFKRTGESRNVDLNWSLVNGLPANDHLVDKIFSPVGTLAALSPVAQDRLFREFARVLRVSGVLIVNEEDQFVTAKLKDSLESLGFDVTPDEDNPNATTFTLLQSSSPMREVGRPNIKEVVMGETRVRDLRTLTPERQ